MALQFTEAYRKQGDIEIGKDQQEGIDFLLSHSGAILSFGTGLGKTITGAVTAKILLDNYPNARCIIVCPVKALKAFRHEFFDRIGMSQQDVGIISTDIMEFDSYTNKVFIFTDTNIEKYQDLVVELAARRHKLFLIIDEAHKLQDKDSKFYKTMSEVKSICQVHWGLSATPILNNLDSLYNIVNFFCPSFLGKKTEFMNRYTNWHLEDQYIKGGRKIKIRVLDSYKNLDELNQRLKQVMLVRQRHYDLKFGNLMEDMTPQEYTIYETVSSGMLGDGEERNFSRRMHDLQRFIDRSYDEDESIKDLVSQYNSTRYSTKEMMFLKALKKTLAQGFSVIVYADYHATVSRLHQILTERRVELDLDNIFEITGSIDIRTREKVEEKIGNKDVVLITSAGSESINLQRANCVIFYDIPFSVKTIIQVVGRICRRDTKHAHQYCLLLVTRGTIDEYKYNMFQTNLALVQASVGVATDLPLEYIGADLKSQDQLKNELLWHYRGNSEAKKRHRKEKKEVKAHLLTCTLADASNAIASHKFLIEPIPSTDPDVKPVPQLYPDRALYERYRRGEIPFTKIRADYLKKLRSEDGKKLIRSLQAGVLKHGSLVLIGQTTEFPDVLKQEVLDQYII